MCLLSKYYIYGNSTTSMQKGSTKVIKVSPENYDKLTEMGKKNESYDDIITRLLQKIDISRLEPT
jgi:hypothetical protein